MPSEGPFLPGSGNEIARLGGSVTWSALPSLSAALAAEGTNYAEAWDMSAAETQFLAALDFGFAIPSEATIDGIQVEVRAMGAFDSGAGSPTFAELRLLVGGSAAGDDLGGSSGLSEAVFTWYSFGGATELWGLAPTPAEVNDSAFGAAVAFSIWGNDIAGAGSYAYVDAIRITVFYTDASAQKARAVAVVSAGSWVAVNAPSIWEAIDEETLDTADYAESPEATAGGHELKVRLAPLADPQVGTGHSVVYEYGKSLGGGDSVNLIVTLYRADGTTVVATQTHSGISATTTGTLTLTSTEADSIPSADYATGLVLGFKEVKA